MCAETHLYRRSIKHNFISCLYATGCRIYFLRWVNTRINEGGNQMSILKIRITLPAANIVPMNTLYRAHIG